MPRPTKRAMVLLTGDIYLAWDMIHRTGSANERSGYDPEDRFEVHRQPGGAWFMTDLLEQIVKNERWQGWKIHGPRPVEPPRTAAALRHDDLSHAFALWTKFPRTAGEEAVRVKGYLGSETNERRHPSSWFPGWNGKDAHIELIVATDDGTEGHENGRYDLLTPLVARTMTADRLPWIVWKDRMLGEGRSLLATLSGKQEPPGFGEERAHELYGRAIAIVGVDVLRRQSRRIGRGSSWESLCAETIRAVVEHGELRRFQRVIVLFPSTGALIVKPHPGKRQPDAQLVMDPNEVGESWSMGVEGEVVGSTTCLVAAVAREMMRERRARPITPDSLDALLAGAVKDGLLRMRALHYLGYDAVRPPSTPVARKDGPPARPWSQMLRTSDDLNPTTYCVSTGFDIMYRDHPDLKKAIEPKKDLCTVNIPFKPAMEWSILGSITEAENRKKNTPAPLPERVVKSGPKALASIPRARFGNLLTTDPREIDALQAIATLLRAYADQPGDKPLSIAVFGAPGSGKSFAVTQIAKQIGRKFSGKPMTFNLSQLPSPELLTGALHQVRDVALTGAIPLVFWDEFDTSLAGVPLGWLRYFLAPMQDGEFLEGQVTHPIGRAVFVFAGGTCETIRGFWPDDDKERAKLKAAKVPDFISRLRGSLDVAGINPPGARSDSTTEVTDVHLQVRRAIILHQNLKRITSISEGDAIRVDDAVVRAFLRAPFYEYGARSLEAIVRMSSLSGARIFTASCLPNAAQLGLHVRDGRAFLDRAGA